MKKIGQVILVSLIILGFIFLVGLVTSYVWNLLMPDLFGLQTINIMQAIGLKALILLLSFGKINTKGKK